MDYCILEGLHAGIDKDEVLKTMDCYEDSPVYEEVAEFPRLPSVLPSEYHAVPQDVFLCRLYVHCKIS